MLKLASANVYPINYSTICMELYILGSQVDISFFFPPWTWSIILKNRTYERLLLLELSLLCIALKYYFFPLESCNSFLKSLRMALTIHDNCTVLFLSTLYMNFTMPVLLIHLLRRAQGVVKQTALFSSIGTCFSGIRRKAQLLSLGPRRWHSSFETVGSEFSLSAESHVFSSSGPLDSWL